LAGIALFLAVAALTWAAGTFGVASYYSGALAGKATASGQLYARTGLTAASYEYYGLFVKVTNMANGRFVHVYVNDRGPNRRLNRAIDLSEAAFAQIAGSADIARGTMQVWIEETPK
jgi:rare lipoprotein A